MNRRQAKKNEQLWDHPGYSPLCTQGKPLFMVIPPEGATIYCPVHPDGHFVYGPPQIIC